MPPPPPSAPPPPPSVPPPPAVPPPPPGAAPTGFAYAGFWQRVAAKIIDGFLYGLVFAVFFIPAIVLFVNAFDGCRTIDDSTVCPDGKPTPWMLGVAIALWAIGFVIVAVLYLRALGRTGQTWGRQIAGVRVVRRTAPEQPLGVGKAFLRTFLEQLLGQACFLNYLWMLWDKERQTWHDKIVDTVVVKE